MQQSKRLRLGFTLTELIVVIAIIGMLASLALISYRKVSGSAKDSKRLADIRQFQTALDRYLADSPTQQYPDDNEIVFGQPLVSLDKKSTFMQKIPINPKPRAEGGCTDTEYYYRAGYNRRSYTIKYCLSSGSSGLAKGECIAYPGTVCVQRGDNACKCNDSSRFCCGECLVGDSCGGGMLAVKNFKIGENVYDLIQQPSGCPSGVTANPSCAGIDPSTYQWSAAAGTNEPVYDIDGIKNTNSLVNQTSPANPAAEYCSNLMLNQFADWYLPSEEELKTVLTSANVNATLKTGYQTASNYWTSNQPNGDSNNARYVTMSTATAATGSKTTSYYTRCIRR